MSVLVLDRRVLGPSQSILRVGKATARVLGGPSQDDHDGGPAAGVASGFDPSGGEPCYQFGNQWDP